MYEYVLVPAVIIGGLALFVIWGYNSLVVLRNRVDNSLAQISVQLKRRVDLIPNLVETVKGYAKHEKTVFENVTKARTGVISASTVEDKLNANNMLTNTLKSLFAVAENYPKLMANENFLKLQGELSEIEDKIAYSRQFYNDVVLMYNNKVQMFPTNILASIFKFKIKSLFEISESEKELPKVTF